MSEDKDFSFVKKDEFSSLIERLIQEENTFRSVVSPVSTFNPSNMTECPRRMVYRAMGTKEEPIRYSYLEFNNHAFIKKKWLVCIKNCRTVKVLEENLVAADCNYNITGNVDAVINVNGIVAVLKICPVTNEDFCKIITRGALKKHVVAIMIDMWLTELNDGILFYENQDTNKYLVFHTKPYRPIIKSVQRKCLELENHRINGSMPVKPYKKENSSECSQCEFFKKCWQK